MSLALTLYYDGRCPFCIAAMRRLRQWDTAGRLAFTDIAEDEAVCPRCGNLRAECSDPERAWYPQRDTCYATGARELVERRLQKRYEKKPPGPAPHPLDGMTVWTSLHDLTPDDDFV